jgi:regulator of cell morphogenesis and NO signaling
MTIAPETTVAAIATAAPATIRVFQQHRIDFCCGGRIPLVQACEAQGVSLDALLGELRAANAPAPEASWTEARLTALIQHIQTRYHEPLRAELPRLSAMLDKVIDRHGDRLPGQLSLLQSTFRRLQGEMLTHMEKEDALLFPFIVALEAGDSMPVYDAAAWIDAPISAMEVEHEDAGAALALIRNITGGYAPPEWACPTFRGLFYGLAQLETDLHLHVHLENNVLFPRAARLARAHEARRAS